MDADLDELDKKIIDVLMRNARLSIPALADEVGTSRATAYNRFDRLVGQGVITGFHAAVDPEALGSEIAALTLVKAAQQGWPSLAEDLAAVPGVVWLGLSVGTSDFVLLLRARSLRHLRDSVLEGLLGIPGVDSIETRVLLDETTPSGLPFGQLSPIDDVRSL